jgi:hypothetical protein
MKPWAATEEAKPARAMAAEKDFILIVVVWYVFGSEKCRVSVMEV